MHGLCCCCPSLDRYIRALPRRNGRIADNWLVVLFALVNALNPRYDGAGTVPHGCGAVQSRACHISAPVAAPSPSPRHA